MNGTQTLINPGRLYPNPKLGESCEAVDHLLRKISWSNLVLMFTFSYGPLFPCRMIEDVNVCLTFSFFAWLIDLMALSFVVQLCHLTPTSSVFIHILDNNHQRTQTKYTIVGTTQSRRHCQTRSRLSHWRLHLRSSPHSRRIRLSRHPSRRRRWNRQRGRGRLQRHARSCRLHQGR